MQYTETLTEEHQTAYLIIPGITDHEEENFIFLVIFTLFLESGADPGFQVRGGVRLYLRQGVWGPP